jgi:hypothetical protein
MSCWEIAEKNAYVNRKIICNLRISQQAMELFFAKGNPETILDPTTFKLVGGFNQPL